MHAKIIALLQESISLKQQLLENEEVISLTNELANTIQRSLEAGGKIILAGNGGSFADAQHLSAEFVSRFMFDRPSLPSLVLGANSSSISAIGNDYGYDQVFAREISSICKDVDVFIPISTSGTSPNILKAIDVAIENNIETIGFTGNDGGKMAQKIKSIIIPSRNTARIQECHITIGHVVCELVEDRLFNKPVDG